MAEFLTFGAQELLKNVASLASQEFSLMWGFKGELANLQKSLLRFQDMITAAERSRQNHGEDAVKSWLKELEDVAREADDVLDDYDYELLRRKMQLRNQINKKVLDFFSLCNPILFRVKMAHRIKKIHTSVEELYKKAAGIGLVVRRCLHATSSHEIRTNRETCSDFNINEYKIIGRDKVVADIVEDLTNSNNNKKSDLISVLAIVGMGGLGKTTVAKSIYHDPKIRQHFQQAMWVCVSTPFEVSSVLRRILESLKPEKAVVQSIEAICKILKEELKGKKYLLVLDDVWNEDDQKWRKLVGLLENVTDTQGSSIIVTTRSDSIGRKVETCPRHDLTKLSYDECWLILKEKAIAVGSAPVGEELERIGKEIAKKCGGIPLVAKVLGNIMRSKSSNEWNSILENEMWDLEDEEERIGSILKLSFDELENPILKRCFAYCSMFAKDTIMEKEDLVQLWMAQGWLQLPLATSKLELEDMGNEYFNILAQRSFFQDFRIDSCGNISLCKMHDLMHDLAIRESNATNFRSLFLKEEAFGSTLPSFEPCLRVLNLYKADIKELSTSIGKLKHLRYLNVMGTKMRAFPKSIGRLYHLETLKMPNKLDEFPKEIANLINLRHVYFGENAEVPVGIMKKWTALRSLPFIKLGNGLKTGSRIEELGALNHLRNTLKIDNLENVEDGAEAQKANLKEKEHLSKLILGWELSRPSNGVNIDEDVLEGLKPHSNMESLEIKGFMGVKFSSWLSLSHKLKEISFENCNKCVGVPALGDMPNLVRLKMKSMQNLKCLGYEFYGYDPKSDNAKTMFPTLKILHIEEVRSLIEWIEVATERVTVFPCLEELTLKNCDQLTSAPSYFPSLKRLTIQGMNNGGTPIASILSDKLTTLTHLEVFSVKGLTCLPDMLFENNKNLAEMGIHDCEDFTCITPTQSHYYCCTSLRLLTIRKCHKLRYLPDELQAPSLEHLEIDDCDSLEYIPIIPELGGLPSLRDLYIYGCPQLSSLPEGIQHCTSLETLMVLSCPKITSIPLPSEGLPSLRRLDVYSCPELTSLPSRLEYSSSLEGLSVQRCPKITSISIGRNLRRLTLDNPEYIPSSLQDAGGFTSLRELEIRYCDLAQIADLPHQTLVSLQSLTIQDCGKLESIPSLEKLTSLCELEISFCSRLRCLPGGLASLTRLKTLVVGRICEELDSFPAFQVLPQVLEELQIYGCSKLKSLPEQIQHLTSLTSLTIRSCDGLEALPEWLGNLASLEHLSIAYCKNLKYLPSVQAMRRLTKFDCLIVHGCPLLSERCIEETGLRFVRYN